MIQNANGIWMLEGEQLWDTDLLPIILEHINPGDTVIDAGAWIGGHAMAYAEKVGGKGKVHAFEPNHEAFQCLKRNTEQFEAYVTCDEVALGDVRNMVAFSVKKGWGDSGHVGYDQDSSNLWMNRLDNYNISPNFIKIDVEGCELKVLKGASKTIEKYRPIMVMEINKSALERQGNTPQEVGKWLEDRGYTLKDADPLPHTLNCYNIICTP